MLRALIIAIAFVTAIASISAQTPPNNPELLRRVDVLDAMLASLQKRVDSLERQLGARSSVPTPGATPAGREVWRRLSKGMSMLDVRSILGEPRRVDGGYRTYWRYEGQSQVTFDNTDRVSGWTEP